MKKYSLFSFIFILSLICFGFLGFNTKSASAANCASGELFNTATGQSCGNPHEVVGCQAGFAFSPVTGQPCPGVTSGGGSGSSDNSSDVAHFNALFKSNFRLGLRGNSDVTALQQFLKDQGYYFGKIDGSYGRITARAVKDFQDDNNVNNTIAPIPVPEPITSAYLWWFDSTHPTCSYQQFSGAYMYQGLQTFGSQSECLSHLPGNTNNPPVISGVSGPQSLNVNQQGTWTVTASDQNNGNLSYGVTWGDEGQHMYSSYSSGAALGSQISTFTHIYSQAGNYNPTFTVTSISTGKNATTSLGVNVGNVVALTQTLSITTPSLLLGAKVGVNYENYLTAEGGTGTYLWNFVSGSLPVNFGSPDCHGNNCSSSKLYGIPTNSGTWTFTVSVTSGSQSATKQFTLIVDSADSVTVSATKNVAFPDPTVIPNQINQKIGSFVITAPNAEGVKISLISIGIKTSTLISSVDFQNIKLMNNGIQLGATLSTVFTGSNLAFDAGNLNLSANASTIIDVYADIKSSAVGSANTILRDINSVGTTTGFTYYLIPPVMAGTTSTASPVNGQNVTFVSGTNNNVPIQVKGLSATASSNSVNLSWSAVPVSTGMPQIGMYDIFRSTSPSTIGDNPGKFSPYLIAQGSVNSYMDFALPAGTFYYRVAAQDVNGLVGPASNQVFAVTNPL